MNQRTLSRFIGNYGMVAALVVLCVYYSWATLKPQSVSGTHGAEVCVSLIAKVAPSPASILIVAGESPDDSEFAQHLARRLRDTGVGAVTTAAGDPRQTRQTLNEMLRDGRPPAIIAATEECAVWLPNILRQMPQLSSAHIITPGTVLWPTFLRAENLLNVANQIVVIAIIAVGMTMVIITGGIDLSVGSLVALAAVIAGVLIRDRAGGDAATRSGLIWCSLAGIAAGAVLGAFTGIIIAFFRVPPFIATLGIMQIASGLAYILSRGQSIYVPRSFVWLGVGKSMKVPNAVFLLALVYLIAYFVMARTRLGRYIYAVGGNSEAARLAGIRVRLVLIIVYITSGIVSGLGGIVLASQLQSSAPTYGTGYELSVIAAVVLGGTSLMGGSGKVLGTLIGALIIGVIQNGMNLTGVESYTQKVVLGLVILGAALLDTLKNKSWRFPSWFARPAKPARAPTAPSDENCQQQL